MLGPALFVLLFLVPTGHPLDAQLRSASDQQALAPLDALRPLAAELWMVGHDLDRWSGAVFLSPSSSSAGRHGLGPPPPGLPRLLLHRSTYGFDADGGAPLARWQSLPVDRAEVLAHALFEAWLDPGRRQAAATLAAWIEPRAEVLMAEVPAEHRALAFRSALADFGGHLVSVANEVYRAAERARMLGKDPCGWLAPRERPVPLLGLWQRSFETGAYPGHYPPPASEDGPRTQGAPWRTTRATLSLEDKHDFVERVLGGGWTGDPAVDFADLCPEEGLR